MSQTGEPAANHGPVSLPFDKFWLWLASHPNCIVRAGTPDVLLLDHDDFHWQLLVEDERTCVVQLARGKEMIAELVMLIEDIAYVHCEMTESEEYVCECVIETTSQRQSAYHFVMAHGYDEADTPGGRRRWTH